MAKQKLKQKVFLSMVFGGPASYTGKNMSDGHRYLLEKGLNDSHVDAVIELLGASLKEHGVKDEDIQEVAAIANSVRDDVLCRKKKLAKQSIKGGTHFISGYCLEKCMSPFAH